MANISVLAALASTLKSLNDSLEIEPTEEINPTNGKRLRKAFDALAAILVGDNRGDVYAVGAQVSFEKKKILRQRLTTIYIAAIAKLHRKHANILEKSGNCFRGSRRVAASSSIINSGGLCAQQISRKSRTGILI